MRTGLLVVGLLAAAWPALAGDEKPERDLGTALYLQAGASSAGGGNMGMGMGMGGGGGALGGSLVVDVSRRLSIEVAGAWLGGGMGASDLTGSGALLVDLRSSREKAVPYLALGAGVYRSGMNGGGMMGSSSSGMTGYGYGPGSGPGYGPMMGGSGMMGGGYGSMTGGYGTGGMMGGGGRQANWDDGGYRWGSSTDPALSLGGGLRIDVGSKVFVRPDARALVVLSGGDSRTVGLFTVSVGYRF